MQNSSLVDHNAGALSLAATEVAYTRNKTPFRPADDLWDWFDGPFHLYLNFLRIDGQFLHLREPFKACMAVFAKGYSSHYVQNLFQAFTHFLSERVALEPFQTISVVEVSNYAGRLGTDLWRIGTLNALLQKWNDLALPWLDPDCAEYLGGRKKPGNEKGAAVRTRDPSKGPFSEDEYIALYKAVDAAYGEHRLAAWALVLTRLLFVCGGRISQYAALKLLDFKRQGETFVISLPQIKNGAEHARVAFKDFALSPQTCRLVGQYVEQRLALGDTAESPMFAETEVMSQPPAQSRRSANDNFLGHSTGATLSKAFMGALRDVAPPTERLNFGQMPVSPRRFRYTLGTRMAEEGASKVLIADALGHGDLQNVDVYFEASPRIVENIDKAMGAMLAPLAQAFRGRLVDGEADTTLKGAPGSRIIDFRVSAAPLASCAGKAQGCAFNKPVACYTCFKFEPWLDGPHDRVLERLEVDRERFADDPRMAAINDDAIQAVREVIAECAAVRAQRAGVGRA